MRNALLGLVTAFTLLAPASFAAACGAAKPDALDPVAVMPDFYKVLIDTDAIRVVDVNMPAGSKALSHSHAVARPHH